jgi:hypothetical protein
VVRALVSDGADALTFADYTIPKRTWDEWWTATIGDWDAERVATVARGDRPLPAPATPSHSTLPLDPGGLLERFGAAAPSSCGSGGVWSNGSLETPPPDNALGATAVWTGSERIPVRSGHRHLAADVAYPGARHPQRSHGRLDRQSDDCLGRRLHGDLPGQLFMQPW